MPEPKQAVILASRDSLLALSQTIAASIRLEKAGFQPAIICLKTSGDIKLDAPLYNVARGLPEKEGRAFFTKELDDALLSGKADAAVHSFKDLPVESVPGISEPVLFSQEDGADVLLLRQGTVLEENGRGLTIGTSSLRRLHQLQFAYPAAQTAMLRGNVVTRLMKLCTGENQMNAILIAGAGLRRLTEFAALPPVSYKKFLQDEVFERVQKEIIRFREYLESGIRIVPLPEMDFPTAPGQGVLALQISSHYSKESAERLTQVFPEHQGITTRVGLERTMMTALGTGCHAPLGVSARPLAKPGIFEVAVCFSRKSETEPVKFSESVYLRRIATSNIEKIVTEIRRPLSRAFWWGLNGGFKTESRNTTPEIISVTAIEQTQLDAEIPGGLAFDGIFISSPAVIPWLQKNTGLLSQHLWAAGGETAAAVSAAFPAAQVRQPKHRGFAAALPEIQQTAKALLWLGSRSGEARARGIGAATNKIFYLPVYHNEPVPPEKLRVEPRLGDLQLVRESIHLVTSKVAAQAFSAFARFSGLTDPAISCFGESATEHLFEEGFTPYHTSRAENFADYLMEIRGETAVMQKRLKVMV